MVSHFVLDVPWFGNSDFGTPDFYLDGLRPSVGLALDLERDPNRIPLGREPCGRGGLVMVMEGEILSIR